MDFPEYSSEGTKLAAMRAVKPDLNYLAPGTGTKVY